MKAKKRFGQNFLIDKNIINQIADSIEATKDDLIVEIGPGRGALTKVLKEKGAHIICYEIDRDMKAFLTTLEDEKTVVKYQDILESDITADINKIQYKNLYIVGNLPYYITTAIIKNLISQKLPIYNMIFMVQEEVADRFTSKPGSREYGSITLYLKYYFNLSKLFSVGRKCFSPVPNVESAIIKLSKREEKPIVDETKYFQLISDSFKMKRKTLRNNLSNYNFEKIADVLNKYHLPLSSRAEELSEEVFIEISKVV